MSAGRALKLVLTIGENFIILSIGMEQLKEIQKRLEPELRAMNKIIAETLDTPNELMNSVVSRYLEIKGKQLRPMLVILSAKMFGKVSESVLCAGAALEMLHNASLIHDDVVDETDLRRGRPTVNATMGNQIAVLVGDFFVSNALAVGIRSGNIEVIAALSSLGKELSLGEIDQITNAREHRFDTESYFSMIRQKTASLFHNCIRMGASIAGASESAIEALSEYADLLGLCFQIKDDIFDYYENPQIGKPTGNDLREGKVTLPLLYALQDAPENASKPMKELLMRGSLDTADIERLVNFAKEYGGVNHAFATMREMQRRADEIIAVIPESESKIAFREIFDFIISRDY